MSSELDQKSACKSKTCTIRDNTTGTTVVLRDRLREFRQTHLQLHHHLQTCTFAPLVSVL